MTTDAALAPLDLARYGYAAGWRGDDLVTAVAVALAESGGRASAHNMDGEDSRGAWQINVGPGANPQYASLDLYNPTTNAAVAYRVWQSGGGRTFRPWTTYTGGAYRRYEDVARRAVAALSLDGEPPIERGGRDWEIPLPGVIPDIPLPDLPFDVGGGLASGALGGAGDVLGWMSDARNWWRVAFIGAGVILVIVGTLIYTRAGPEIARDLARAA